MKPDIVVPALVIGSKAQTTEVNGEPLSGWPVWLVHWGTNRQRQRDEWADSDYVGGGGYLLWILSDWWQEKEHNPREYNILLTFDDFDRLDTLHPFNASIADLYEPVDDILQFWHHATAIPGQHHRILQSLDGIEPWHVRTPEEEQRIEERREPEPLFPSVEEMLRFKDIDEVLTEAEAAHKWRIDRKSLRRAVDEAAFRRSEYRYTGKTLLFTRTGMRRVFGPVPY